MHSAIRVTLGLFVSLITLGCAASQAVVTERWITIPPGTYQMGSPASEPLRFDNETQHTVQITKSFQMAVTPVTVDQFARFVKATGYQTTAEKEGFANGAWSVLSNRWIKLEGASWINPGFAQTGDHPVVCVTWHDANAYCAWLTKTTGKTHRLPTEAEWEYACRAGTTSAYFWGEDPDAGRGFANACDQTAKDLFNIFPPFNWNDGYLYTSPVGSFRPNPWGLHDAIGNTLEWCSDWFADYPTTESTDPTGPAEGKQRILRGGAFVYGPKHCRNAFRGRNDPDFRNIYIGFRVVVEP